MPKRKVDEIHERIRQHEQALGKLQEMNKFNAGYMRARIVRKVMEEQKVSREVIKEAEEAAKDYIQRVVMQEPEEYEALDESLYDEDYILKKYKEEKKRKNKLKSISPLDPKLWFLSGRRLMPEFKDAQNRKKILEELGGIDKPLRPLAWLASITRGSYPDFKEIKASSQLEKALIKIHHRLGELEGIPGFRFTGEESSIAMGYTAAVTEETPRYHLYEEYPVDSIGEELNKLPDIKELVKKYREYVKKREEHSRELAKIFFKELKPRLEEYGEVKVHSLDPSTGEEIKNPSQLAKLPEAKVLMNGEILGRLNLRKGELVMEGANTIKVEVSPLEKALEGTIHGKHPIAGRPLSLSEVYKALVRSTKH